ncbi:unnamed protein product [Mytilus edulis]|uniref:Nucleotidyltransferase n=1 Tax=Mytilus edulis TaxID=6550 RepID=A0A8S3S6J2_MYTED|nr:unnamed protein product [Mytilus edulis]
METRNEELETASIELYQYMCNTLVGSEKIVRYRRLFFKLFDETWNTQRGFELISSGSKSEGLDLHGSDFDLMTLQKLFKVYENIDSSGFCITIDTNNAQPGFALLKVPENIGKCCPVLFPKTDNGYLLSSRKMRDLLTVKSRLYNGAFSIHGPSVCHNEVDLDRVYCLQCNTWPFAAKDWLLRNKSIEWPPQEVMENITEQAHYELGNIHQADRHMRMLQNTVQNTESGNPHLSVNANTYLMRALSFSNDLAGFQLTSKRVLQMMKKSDEYKTFLKDVLTVNDSLAPLARMIQNLDR